MEIKELISSAHINAINKGWYEGGARNIPEALALIISEIVEALEEYRDPESIYGDWNIRRYHEGKPVGFRVELADAVIRIADLCGHLGIDLESAITEKMEYNKTRPYRHGNKRA